jgi:hypothetical protein
MIDKILITEDDGENLGTEEKINRTHTASIGSQTQGMDFPTNLKDELVSKTVGKNKVLEACAAQNVDKRVNYVHDKNAVLTVAPSKSVFSQNEEEFEHSERNSVTYNDEGVIKESESSSEEEEECLEEEDDNEWFEESEAVDNEDPQFYQWDPRDQYHSATPYHWPPTYSPYFYYPYSYSSNALQPRMTREQRKFMFNYRLTSSHYQQQSYISAMLSNFY